MTTLTDDQLSGPAGFSGELVRPGDPGYDEARSIHNGLIDKRPALIARCRSAADIASALAFAQADGLPVSVRGGGHNVAGICLVDDGVVVDLSQLTHIEVDAAAMTATAGPGVMWGAFNDATQPHGLATTGGVVSTTGIAGLTLGGGIGWLMPKFGLATDNLVSAEVVTVDGRTLTASESENADLFWGIRGGGGNFGVVSSFTYRLHEVGPMITGGLILHPFPAAAELLRFFRDATADIPDELMVVAGLVHAPDGSGTKATGLIVCHVGPPEQAERDLEAFTSFGAPIMVEVGPMPYSVLNTVLDERYPRGALNYWKSAFAEELSDAAIDTAIAQFETCPSPMTGCILEHFHGAVCRVPVEATAVAMRRPGYNYLVTSVWTDPTATDENVAWTRETFGAMDPFLSDLRYVNYLDADDAATGEAPVRGAYGSNYGRLAALKAKYDPDNVLRSNFNVPPG
jgi:FAD/FMN-containing dehydrogenase